MKYRMLGNTGVKVSEIGYGAWGIGGDAYGPVDDNESKAALATAFDKGINFFDTANLYGSGHSEELLGEVFNGKREKIILATKGGTLPHSTFSMPQDFSSTHLREALTGSLRRLRTGHVDVYLLHSPAIEDIKVNKAIETLGEFRKEGKVKFYGVSTRSPQDALRIMEECDVDVLEVNFNIIDHRALEIGLFEKAKKKGVGIIIRTPLAFGYLSGKLTGREKFPGKDHRTNWPQAQLDRWAGAPGVFSFLYAGRNSTPAQAALRFCLAYDSVSTVIPGMMNREQVLENAAAGEIPPLTIDDINRIRSIYKDHDFYDNSAKLSKE